MARILMVDDEEMDRTLGRAVLEEAGHELLYAPNGNTALRIYQGQSVDLVITDLAMPSLNGLRLIEEIMAHDPAARIIAVTGVSPEQLDRAGALGAAKTMRKPYAPRQLLDAVTEVLERGAPRPPGDLWGGR
jgi:CheY-like chemotaxis protein